MNKKMVVNLFFLLVFTILMFSCARDENKKMAKGGEKLDLSSAINLTEPSPSADPIEQNKKEKFEELKRVLAEPQPAREDYRAVWFWRDSLYSFVLYNDKPEELKEEIYKGLEKRSQGLADAIDFYLKKNNQPLPECGGIDPMYSVISLWERGDLSRDLMIKILFAQTKKNLVLLRSDLWDDQDGARLYWRLTAGRFNLSQAELEILGLRQNEIKNILWR